MQLPITPYKIKKAYLYWKHFGTREFMNHLLDRMEPEEVPYGQWFTQHRATEETLKKQRIHPIAGGPKISVLVPAFLTPERFFIQMLDYVKGQRYENWELVIADACAGEEEMSAAGAGRKK